MKQEKKQIDRLQLCNAESKEGRPEFTKKFYQKIAQKIIEGKYITNDFEFYECRPQTASFLKTDRIKIRLELLLNAFEDCVIETPEQTQNFLKMINCTSYPYSKEVLYVTSLAKIWNNKKDNQVLRKEIVQLLKKIFKPYHLLNSKVAESLFVLAHYPDLLSEVDYKKRFEPLDENNSKEKDFGKSFNLFDPVLNDDIATYLIKNLTGAYPLSEIIAYLNRRTSDNTQLLSVIIKKCINAEQIIFPNLDELEKLAAKSANKQKLFRLLQTIDPLKTEYAELYYCLAFRMPQERYLELNDLTQNGIPEVNNLPVFNFCRKIICQNAEASRPTQQQIIETTMALLILQNLPIVFWQDYPATTQEKKELSMRLVNITRIKPLRKTAESILQQVVYSLDLFSFPKLLVFFHSHYNGGIYSFLQNCCGKNQALLFEFLPHNQSALDQLREQPVILAEICRFCYMKDQNDGLLPKIVKILADLNFEPISELGEEVKSALIEEYKIRKEEDMLLVTI